MDIGKDWKIESDSLNVILYRKKTRKRKDTGEAYIHWEEVGYFASVENALLALVSQGVRDTELKDLKTVVAEIKKLEAMVKMALSVSTSPLQPSKGLGGSNP